MSSDETMEFSDADAAFSSGIAAFEAKNFSQALSFLMPLAEDGDVDSGESR